MPLMLNDDLVFDLGLHHGNDTDFYLRKGFRVVAVEANPQLCVRARRRFAAEIDAGRLVIIDKAVDREGGRAAAFHLRTDKDDWSSLDSWHAHRDGQKSETIEVETTTLQALVSEHGLPYYLKCDIEGADAFVVDQIGQLPQKPRYVSVEASGEFVRGLDQSGYRRFQLVNQGWHHLFPPPRPPREGTFASCDFTAHISGLFGRELPLAGWCDAETAGRRLSRWRRLNEGRASVLERLVSKHYGRLTGKSWLIGRGWLDIHAELGEGT
jgi:FkbM family methyltransferase